MLSQLLEARCFFSEKEASVFFPSIIGVRDLERSALSRVNVVCVRNLLILLVLCLSVTPLILALTMPQIFKFSK